MERHVNVELKDGSVCRMARKAFNIFLVMGKVARFERADGWVKVDSDPMRDPDRISDYPSFADRRRHS